MAKKRKSEAGAVVIFFQTQPIDVAKSILDICIDTIAARAPKVEKNVKGSGRKKTTKTEGGQQSLLASDKVS